MAAALLVVVLASSPAPADSPFDYGYTGGSDDIRQPDSRDHWHCKNNFDMHHDWLNSAMSQLDAQTVMTRHDSSSCGSSTDVVWVKTGLNAIEGGALVGRTICVAHVTWGICDQYWVLIDQPAHFVDAAALGGSDPTAWYTVNLQQTIRHELGHTAGLHHYLGGLNPAFGAMISVWIPNGTPGWLSYLAYSPFQVNLIDSHV